jgi:hypothetical protein
VSYPNTNTLNSPVNGHVDRIIDSYTGAVSITPSDSTLLSSPVRALIVAVDGNLNLTFFDGSQATIAVVAGGVYHFLVTQVWATGTTATGIVGLY